MGAQGKSSGVVLDGNRGVSEVEKAGRSNLRRSNSQCNCTDAKKKKKAQVFGKLQDVLYGYSCIDEEDWGSYAEIIQDGPQD